MGALRWRLALFLLITGLALAWWLVLAVRGELPLGVAVAGTVLFFSQRLLMESPRRNSTADATAGHVRAVAAGVLPRWYFELRLLEETTRHQRTGRPLVVACFRGPMLRRSGTANRLLRHATVTGRLDEETVAICLTDTAMLQSIPILREVMAGLGDDDGWQVAISVLPDDGTDHQQLLDVAQRRLMPWRLPQQHRRLA
jgi:hypothetical protein